MLVELFHKYPLSLPEEEVAPLLGVLQQAYVESKTHDVTKWLQRCLCALARGQTRRAGLLNEFTVEKCRSHWQKVWSTTLRLISLHHATEDGFQVLTLLLRENLLQPDKDMWTIFLPTICHSSEHGVYFLVSFLQQYVLPENHRPNMLVSMDMQSDVPYPLRHQLLEWLLPPRDDWSENSGWKPISKHVNCLLLAGTLTALTLRDTRTIRVPVTCDRKVNQTMEKIESTFLTTTFDHELETGHSAMESCVIAGHIQASTLRVIEELLHEFLDRDSRLLLDTTEVDVRLLEDVAHQCSLLVKVLYSQLIQGILTIQNLPTSSLYDLLKALMKKLTSIISELVKKNNATTLLPTVCALAAMYSWSDCSSDSTHQMARICRDVTPREMLDKLFTIVYEKVIL